MCALRRRERGKAETGRQEADSGQHLSRREWGSLRGTCEYRGQVIPHAFREEQTGGDQTGVESASVGRRLYESRWKPEHKRCQCTHAQWMGLIHVQEVRDPLPGGCLGVLAKWAVVEGSAEEEEDYSSVT